MLIAHTQKQEKMFSMKIIAYLFNPKILIAVLLFDLSHIITFLNKYMFSDFTYLKWLMIVMALDLVTGVTKVWKNEGLKAITSKGLRDTISKVIQYAAFLIVTHVLTHYQVNGQNNTGFQWVSKYAYEFLILIEIKSVYENIIRINPKLDLLTHIFKKVQAVLTTEKEISNKN